MKVALGVVSVASLLWVIARKEASQGSLSKAHGKKKNDFLMSGEGTDL